MRLLHDGGELVEVEQRDDGLGGEEGDDGDVHLRERRRETLCVILRKFGGARFMTRQVGVARRNKKKFNGLKRSKGTRGRVLKVLRRPCPSRSEHALTVRQ